MLARAALAAAVAAGVLAAGCSEDRRFPTADDLGRDFEPSHVITVDSRGFEPGDVTIAAGEVVLLVNDGDGPHSFSAEERLETGALEPGEEVVFIPEQPGEIRFADRVGGTGNEGRIVVEG